MMERLVVSITRSTATETFLGAAKYYVDEMWPLVTRMYVWGHIAAKAIGFNEFRG